MSVGAGAARATQLSLEAARCGAGKDGINIPGGENGDKNYMALGEPGCASWYPCPPEYYCPIGNGPCKKAKKPGSYYHLSKVFDSYNIEFCCRSWGLRTTDLNQGIVYGIETNETILHKDLATSFHYDEVFGTILNRFISQSVIGNDITVYGSGKQIRSFLNIKDTMQCIKIALKNKAKKSEYRVFNQFTECFSVNELAKKIIKIGKNHGSKSKLIKIQNPRVEMSEHYYNPKSTNLKKLGLKPNLLSDDFLNNFYKLVNQSKSNIKKSAILPKISW